VKTVSVDPLRGGGEKITSTNRHRVVTVKLLADCALAEVSKAAADCVHTGVMNPGHLYAGAMRVGHLYAEVTKVDRVVAEADHLRIKIIVRILVFLTIVRHLLSVR